MKDRPSGHPEKKRTADGRPIRHRRRRLRTIAMLPALLTLGNLFFGFMAVYCCLWEMHDLGAEVDSAAILTLKKVLGESINPTYLSIGVFLLIGALFCDALDGRVARLTDHTSRFGEQLDSLADAVSFGVAPAMLMITLVQRELVHWGEPPLGFGRFGQFVVFIGAIYASCAVLRLARFTVEASIEEASHEGFRGLPSPGAAASVMSLVLLHESVSEPDMHSVWASGIAMLLPACTLAVALLMVSRIPYVHAVSAFLRRRPFGHVVITLLVLPLLVLYPAQMALLAAWGFVLSGPLKLLLRKKKPAPHVEGPPANDAAPETAPAPDDPT